MVSKLKIKKLNIFTSTTSTPTLAMTKDGKMNNQ
jgi:hypothetical protein